MSAAIPRRLYTTSDVALALNIPLNRLYRTIRVLRTQHGFPQPVPGLGSLYDPLAIDAWLARQRAASLPPGAAQPAAEPDGIDGWQAELDRRAALLGRRGRAA